MSPEGLATPVASRARLIRTRRLIAGDELLAAELFALMARVFEEPATPLGETYLSTLLARREFWAIVAFVDERMVGGLTAHALPMTREEATELFIYDIAVHVDFQRRGIGRMLMTDLRVAAQEQRMSTVFVPADNDDVHALDFYRALGGVASPVTFFTFDAEAPPRS